ncbi:MAG: type II toxin-antitoxin system prevent-host-death family antitoxin [Alphaproteobacteria bacterium]|nr:type II toxin-antitoxin system prevent-host-death family antitoxin [Alphaproteobacteria bacterium]
MPTVGAYDAETRLPDLLRQVKRGKRFTITHRGQLIAELVPAERAGRRNAHEAVEAMRKIKPVPNVPAETVAAWISKGRE